MSDGINILRLSLAAILVLGICLAGCTGTENQDGQTTPNETAAPPSGEQLRIATTTSLYDTGLLDRIEDTYEAQTGVDLQISSQGTGKAIELATRCDVDLLFVHSPSQEQAFLDAGYGTNHRCIAYNFFQIVGPEDDPAGIAGMDPVEGFRELYEQGTAEEPGVQFVSRGDDSGTHSKEKTLWDMAGYDYETDVRGSGEWYVEAGKGMGETLVMASETDAYTLTDEGTYLAFQGDLVLVPIIDQGDALLNRYSVMAVNPEHCPGVNIEEANNFIDWMISDEAKDLISSFGVEDYGKALFTPLYAPECTATPFNCSCAEPVSET
ncbi:MAG: substrate-binding domain-containing protein [Methanomicrobiaceae archaeon]|nr:substrate-binding domain-containing protein [Methanomicrobiaceae archaeon]